MQSLRIDAIHVRLWERSRQTSSEFFTHLYQHELGLSYTARDQLRGEASGASSEFDHGFLAGSDLTRNEFRQTPTGGSDSANAPWSNHPLA